MQDAPLYPALADGPDEGAAWWLETSDGVRIRVGLWNRGADKGTVFLFPGRTEYIEKYGITASDFAAAGFATFAIDWRGQGLADRLLRNIMAGHVNRFGDYQLDVQAMTDAAHALNLPRPWHMIGHSMGGAIGLRALHEGLDVKSAAFSGPMWDIELNPFMYALARSLSLTGCTTGLGSLIAPGAIREAYVLKSPFDDNNLTTDQAMYDRMIAHLHAEPRFMLAGPTMRWLHEAFVEMKDLRDRLAPDYPCLTIMGDDEAIVSQRAIRERMNTWPDATLKVFERGRHEVLMDTPEMRTQATDTITDHFLRHK